MKQGKLNEWFSILTNLAVIAGLILVAYEISQNNTALESDVVAARAQMGEIGNTAMRELYTEIAADKELAEVWVKGNSRSELNEIDQTRYDLISTVYVRNMLSMFIGWENIREGLGDFVFQIMTRDSRENPGLKLAMQRFLEVQPGGEFGQRLQALVDSI